MNHALQHKKHNNRAATSSKPVSIKHANSIKAVLQPKLKIGAPNDKYEQEADRVADQVMRMPIPTQSSPINSSPTSNINNIQRKCAGCAKEDELVQKKASGTTPDVTPTINSSIQSLQGKGQPLSKSERNFFEPRFGADFSQVRLHTDNQAASTAKSINARAFTHGNNVIFGAGEYSSGLAGRKIMAHELTHTIQQRTSKVSSIQRLGDLSQVPSTMLCKVATTSAGFITANALFEVGSFNLSSATIAEIASFIVRWRSSGANKNVRIDGYASTDGSDPLNWQLSCDRAAVVENELLKPSSGGTGIPPSFIEVFAQGETNQFATTLIPNRRSTISSNLTPTVCTNPGASRTLDLQPIFLRLNAADASPTGTTFNSRFNKANEIWGKLGVTFNKLSPVTIDTPLKTSGGSDPEILAVMALRSSSGVEVFFVDNDVAGQGGAATLQTGCNGNEKTIIADRGTSDTILAHEMGHVMGLGHNGNNSDPGTVMDTTGSHSVNNPTKNTMANYNFISCPAATGSTCLDPDT